MKFGQALGLICWTAGLAWMITNDIGGQTTEVGLITACIVLIIGIILMLFFSDDFLKGD